MAPGPSRGPHCAERRLGRAIMDGITDFLSMGGYAEFVWPAFAVTLAVMAALMIVSRRALLADRRTLESLESVRESRRNRRRGAQGSDAGGTGLEA